MKRLLKFTATAALITALSACATVGQREIVSTKNQEKPKQAIYPSSALKRCPEKLSTINLTQSEWDALSPQAQVVALNNQGRQWVVDYFKCAIRHNIGADVYEEQIKALGKEPDEIEEPKKPWWKFS